MNLRGKGEKWEEVNRRASMLKGIYALHGATGHRAAKDWGDAEKGTFACSQQEKFLY